VISLLRFLWCCLFGHKWAVTRVAQGILPVDWTRALAENDLTGCDAVCRRCEATWRDADRYTAELARQKPSPR
jgi:hypothetical protein